MRVTKARRRSKLVTALLLPALVVMWMVGWSLTWIGRAKDAKREQPQPKRRETDVTLVPAMTLEQEEADEEEQIEMKLKH